MRLKYEFYIYYETTIIKIMYYLIHISIPHDFNLHLN